MTSIGEGSEDLEACKLCDGSYGRVKRRTMLLETHVRLARSYHVSPALISRVLQRVHNFANLGAVVKPSLVKLCDRLVHLIALSHVQTLIDTINRMMH